MNLILTENELLLYLARLKKYIQGFDYLAVSNVIFFNLESFYIFIKNKSSPVGDETVEDLLEILEPYIPITIDEVSFCSLLDCIYKNDSEMENFQSLLTKKSKIEFINLVRNAKSDAEWSHVVNLVSTVRELKSAAIYTA